MKPHAHTVAHSLTVTLTLTLTVALVALASCAHRPDTDDLPPHGTALLPDDTDKSRWLATRAGGPRANDADPATLPFDPTSTTSTPSTPSTPSTTTTSTNTTSPPAPTFASANAYLHYLRGQLAALTADATTAADEYRKALAHDDASPAILLELARQQVRLGHTHNALATCRRGVEVAPSHPQLWLLLGRLLLARPDKSEAIAALERAATLAPRDLETADHLAAVYLLLRRESDAIATYARLTREPGLALDAGPRLADLYWRIGDATRALDAARDNLTRDRGDVTSLRLIAALKQQKGDIDGAIAAQQQVLFYYPGERDTMAALARTYYRANRNTDGDATLARLLLSIEAEQPRERAATTVGIIAYDERRYDTALTHFRAALAAEPTFHLARIYLAWTLEKLGKHNDAAQQLRRVPHESRLYGHAVYSRMRLLQHDKKDDAALTLASDALKLIRDENVRFELLDARTQLLARKGRLKEAEASLAPLADGAPPDIAERVYTILGVAAELANDMPRSLYWMQRALDANPENANALNYIGYTWADEGKNLEQALGMLQMAVALEPESGHITDSLGWVYFRLGDHNRALNLLERANYLAPREPVILLHLGDACAATGDLDRARTLWREALRYDPKPEDRKTLESRLKP